MSEVIGLLTITQPREYVKRYATACNYDAYTLLPGTYEIDWHASDYEKYAVVNVNATHDRRYMQSSLFTAASVDTSTQEGTITVGLYRSGDKGPHEALRMLTDFGLVSTTPTCDVCGTTCEELPGDAWCGECGWSWRF